MCVRRLPQLGGIKRLHSIANCYETLFTSMRLTCRTLSGDKSLTRAHLQSDTEPRHASTNWTLRNAAFPCAKTIVHDVDKGRFPSLRRADYDVDLTSPESELAPSSIVTVK